MGGKLTTQRATKVVAGEFPVAVGCPRAIELIIQIAGKPTTALDVTIQAQILDLLRLQTLARHGDPAHHEHLRFTWFN
jgi:hypothetical protein